MIIKIIMLMCEFEQMYSENRSELLCSKYRYMYIGMNMNIQ